MTARSELFRYEFPAMGSTVELYLVGTSERQAETAAQHALQLAHDWEDTFSRFQPESELSRLNAHSGQTVTVSERLLAGISAALDAARVTDGLFDPTILPALSALGYDHSFHLLANAAVEPLSHSERPRSLIRPPGVSEIEIDEQRRTVLLPDNVTLDLGGIAKGMFADTLAGQLAAWSGGIVSAGGDLQLWGRPPDHPAWIVGIEHPDDPGREIEFIEINDGAVATSGRNRRQWKRGGQRVHHLIDPRTGRSADTGINTVTVVAEQAVSAEVVATALFVAGADAVTIDALRARNAFSRAIAVAMDGTVTMIHGSERGYARAQSPAAA